MVKVGYVALFAIALEVYIYLLNKFQLVTLISSQGVTFYEVYSMPKNAIPFRFVMYYNLRKYCPGP